MPAVPLTEEISIHAPVKGATFTLDGALFTFRQFQSTHP